MPMQPMQKKRTATIFLVLAMVLSIAASAAPSPRYNTTSACDPMIKFSGTTATCSFTVDAYSGTEISATMKLYRVSGSSEILLKTWATQRGTTSLSYSNTYSVSKGYTYKITVDVAADGPGGYDSISKSLSAKCS